MKSIFEESSKQEILKRLDTIDANRKSLWGKMSAAQMLAHCNEPLMIALGKKTQAPSGNFLIRLLFKSSLYNDVPYRKNLPTDKSFIITGHPDFELEKGKLTEQIKTVYQLGLKHTWPVHPTFGQFTAEQHGKLIYKHLDHHFSQFGV